MYSVTREPTPLNKEGLCIHEGLAKDESSLAMQLRTEKIGPANFYHKQRVPTATLSVCPCGWGIDKRASISLLFCPFYNVGSRDSVGAPRSCTKLISMARRVL